jgi:hypothetical protein
MPYFYIKIFKSTPHIFYMLFEKSYDMVLFFALVYTLNHNFCNETTAWEKSVESLVYQK